MSKKDYFYTELQLLKNALTKYGEDFPVDGRSLHIDASVIDNPQLARLLEGCAYLNSRIKEQIDLGTGHIWQNLLQQSHPEYLRSQPSKTIFQLNAREIITKHSEFLCNAVGPEATNCTFRITNDVEPIPAEIIKLSSDFNLLTLKIKVLDKIKARSWRIFINSLDASWLEVFEKNLTAIKLGTTAIPMQKIVMQPAGSIDKLLHGYYLFPQQYFFIDIMLPACDKNFELSFHFDKQPCQVSDELFKLNCVVAENIFSSQAEPIAYDEQIVNYKLELDHRRTQSVQFQKITQVRGINHLLSQDILFEHSAQEISSPWYYHYQATTPQGIIQNYLRLAADTQMNLSISVLANNATYPFNYLPKNQLFTHKSVEAISLLRPTKFVATHIDEELLCNLLNLVNLDVFAIKNLAKLKKILELHDKRSSNIHQAISFLDIENYTTLEQGIFVEGLNITVHLEEQLFSNSGQIYLFCKILHSFFIMLAPLNLSIKITAFSMPSQNKVVLC